MIICLEILSIILDYDFEYRGCIFFSKLKKILKTENSKNVKKNVSFLNYVEDKNLLKDFDDRNELEDSSIIL